MNLPWAQALHLPVCSASRTQSVCPSSRGIIRLSMVAPGWPSLPCQSPDLVGVSPTNTASTVRVLVPQFATAGSLWGPSLQLGASDSTRAFWPRLACISALNLFRSDPVDGTRSLYNYVGTKSHRNPGTGSWPSGALWGLNLVTANAHSYLEGAQPVGGLIFMLYRHVVPVFARTRVSPLRFNSMASSPCTNPIVRWIP